MQPHVGYARLFAVSVLFLGGTRIATGNPSASQSQHPDGMVASEKVTKTALTQSPHSPVRMGWRCQHHRVNLEKAPSDRSSKIGMNCSFSGTSLDGAQHLTPSAVANCTQNYHIYLRNADGIYEESDAFFFYQSGHVFRKEPLRVIGDVDASGNIIETSSKQQIGYVSP